MWSSVQLWISLLVRKEFLTDKSKCHSCLPDESIHSAITLKMKMCSNVHGSHTKEIRGFFYYYFFNRLSSCNKSCVNNLYCTLNDIQWMLFTGLRFDSVSDQIKEDCHAEQDFNQNYTAVAPFLFLMFFCYQKRIFSY